MMEVLRAMHCNGLQSKIEVTEDEVRINGDWKVIPRDSIQAVKLYPVLESAPARGGCLKMVTEDNPGLPERDDHSFHIPGTDITSGMILPKGNCFWFNCLSPGDCADVNEQAEEMKSLIESTLQ